MIFKRKPKEHIHTGHDYDGYWERCKCGARRIPGQEWK